MNRNHALAGCAVVVASALGLGCGLGDREWPHLLKSSDGVLYLQTTASGGWLFGALTVESNGSSTLFASADQGKTWDRMGEDWNDFLFLDRRHGFLARGDSLFETTDGMADNAKLLHRFPGVIGSVSAVGKSLMVSAGDRLFECRDGRDWAAVDFGADGPANRPVAVAGDDTHLAVATARGWVWIRRSDGSWGGSIVGPVLDLGFSKGLFFALTEMATVAVLDGESVRHHRLPPHRLSGARFSHLGDRLLFATQETLYELAEGAPVPVLQFQSPSLVAPLLAMVGEDEAVRVSWPGPDGFLVESINLRSRGVRELSRFAGR